MTPEQLKASILQYAIQGKLVEQRPEEGTGEELYQKMQTDKQTLIREKKIKKEISPKPQREHMAPGRHRGGLWGYFFIISLCYDAYSINKIVTVC